MYTYLLGLIPVLIFFYTPIVELFSPSLPQSHGRPPRQLTSELFALDEPSNHTCPTDNYLVHVFSREPLVLYVENFLSTDERDHLLEIRFVLNF